VIFVGLEEGQLDAVREAVSRVEQRRMKKLHAFLLPVADAWE
jgi:hypothetical protein